MLPGESRPGQYEPGMPGRDFHSHPRTHRETLTGADPSGRNRVQIQAGVAAVRPGWKNRPISEKPKAQPHGKSPYRQGTLVHWRDVVLRTLPGRLVLLLAALVLLGLVTAAVGHYLLGAQTTFGEALWKSLTHMLDPGSLADDDTVGERITGVTQVLIGIIFLAGIVLTVLTEVVDRALLRLQQGDPAVRETGHLLLVGMNLTLAGIRHELLPTLDGRHPTIVVMLPPEQSESRHAARQALAGYPGRTHIVVADPRNDGFSRVCAGSARHIVLLSPETDPDAADIEVTTRAALLTDHLAGIGEAPPVAVELRRGRNLEALWVGSSGESRFPDNFDALVIDRNIGTLLGLVVLNPQFSGVFLGTDGHAAAPDLLPADGHAGSSFAAARDDLDGASLLGILNGEGPAARARYLPGPDTVIGPNDRLIVIRDDSGRIDPRQHRDPGPVKVAPARPGPLLVLDFSDAAAALLQTLEVMGYPQEKVTVLGSEQRAERPGFRIAPEVRWIEGDAGDPDDIGHALERSDPAIVFAAAFPGREAEAVISGRLARRRTGVPVVVEQPGAVHEVLGLAADRITVVSTTAMTAEAVALSLTDPALVVARESMLDDPGLRLESLVYTGSGPLSLADVPAIFSAAGYYPLAVSVEDRDGDGSGLVHGDQVLAMRRVGQVDP